VAPAVDGVGEPGGGELAGAGEVAAAAGGVGGEVVVLQAGVEFVGVDAVEGGEGVVDAVEAQEIVGGGEEVVGAGAGAVGELLEEAVPSVLGSPPWPHAPPTPWRRAPLRAS